MTRSGCRHGLLNVWMIIGLALVFAGREADGASRVSQTYNIEVLATICADPPNCKNGATPEAGLLMDVAGDLYGTTGGGSTAFRMTPGKHRWEFQTIYRFCDKQGICRRGATPNSTLVEDTAGNLYGTAFWGGLANSGTVFELTPDPDHKEWLITMLHDFCTKGNCPDGQNPEGGLTYAGAGSGRPYDGTSPLYGVTMNGGAANSGVIFEVTPSQNGKWDETVLYSFCAQDGCPDGSLPNGAPILDASGNLYGVTLQGGTHNSGTAFEVSKGKKKWSEAVLHSFCSEDNCTDGDEPGGALLMDASGNLYGTAAFGGNAGKGVVYELTPDGNQWEQTVLYAFCVLRNCADGIAPQGSLIADGSGDLYGVTYGGGAVREGEAFELVPSGTQSQLTVLYSFCSQANCADGENPNGGLVMDASGNLYGTTQSGGKGLSGIVFELTPP